MASVASSKFCVKSSQVQIINEELPAGLTDPDAISAYQQGYAHMRNAAWFAAIAAYDEAIRIEPDVSGLYEACGTAYIYARRHDEALADYKHAVELNPNDAGHWHRRAHAYTIAPTPEPERGVEDGTRAIELDPEHCMVTAKAISLLVRKPSWSTASAALPKQVGVANLQTQQEDPRVTTQQYQQTSERFLAHTRQELAAGDLPQASEKGWGAAAHMLNAIAEQRG